MFRIALVTSVVCLVSSLAAAGEGPIRDALTVPGKVEIRTLHDGRVESVTVKREPVTYLIKVKVLDFPRIDSNMPAYRAPGDVRYSMRYYANGEVRPLAAPGAAPGPLQLKPPSGLRRWFERLVPGKTSKKP